jgi:hypothetical protein
VSTQPLGTQSLYVPRGAIGVVQARVGQIVTFFAYRPSSRPQGSRVVPRLVRSRTATKRSLFDKRDEGSRRRRALGV